MARSGQRPDAETVFLSLVGRCAASGIAASESPNAGNYAPKIFAKRPDRDGYTKKDFERAMHALFANGRIEATNYRDENARPKRRIALAEAGQEGQ